MSLPIQLVPKPIASDRAKADVVDILRELLVKAERGEITQLGAVYDYVDGSWEDRLSPGIDFSQFIGHIEVAKAAWIKRFMDAQKK